jgi:hypothetical protein
LGLLPPLAIGHVSVKAPQLGPEADLLPEDAREAAPVGRAVEAGKAPARVDAATRLAPAGHEHTVANGEPQQLTLRRATAAAGAAPHRSAR